MDRALIEQAAKSLSIQMVLLRSCEVKAEDSILQPIESELALQAKFRSGCVDDFQISTWSDNSSSDVTMVVFRFGAGVRLVDRASDAGDEGSDSRPSDIVKLEISSEFGAHYRLRPEIDPEPLKSALKEFARYNVGLHVWPYWRELVQSTCFRMGIPTIPVPMYQIPSEP